MCILLGGAAFAGFVLWFFIKRIKKQDTNQQGPTRDPRYDETPPGGWDYFDEMNRRFPGA